MKRVLFALAAAPAGRGGALAHVAEGAVEDTASRAPGRPNRTLVPGTTAPGLRSKSNGTEEITSRHGTLALAGHGRQSRQLGQRRMPTPYPLRTVEHEKVPGNGYKEGSPLYWRQQEREPAAASGPRAKSLGPTPAPSSGAAAAAAALRAPEAPRWNPWKEVWNVLLMFFLSFLQVCLIAWAYLTYGKKRFPPGPKTTPLRQGDSFTYGLCDCSNLNKDWPICLMAFCCPAIRWADTMSMAHLQRFWVALLLMATLILLIPFTFGVCLALAVLVGVFFRQRLRKIYGHGAFSCKNMVLDILAWVLCTCCVLVQEAREVEKVQKDQLQGGTPQARSPYGAPERSPYGVQERSPYGVQDRTPPQTAGFAGPPSMSPIHLQSEGFAGPPSMSPIHPQSEGYASQPMISQMMPLPSEGGFASQSPMPPMMPPPSEGGFPGQAPMSQMLPPPPSEGGAIPTFVFPSAAPTPGAGLGMGMPSQGGRMSMSPSGGRWSEGGALTPPSGRLQMPSGGAARMG